MNPHPDHPLYTQAHKTAILMVNLGTPDKPSTFSVAQYLREFLSDPRVIQIPKLLWYPILYGIILPFRSPASAKKYRRVWDDDSPLRTYLHQLVTKLNVSIPSKSEHEINIYGAMRYGQPSIKHKLNLLQKKGYHQIIVLPLFPQYSAVTTASIFDEIATHFKRWPYLPEFRFINTYHDHPLYIQALKAQIQAHWQQTPRGQHLLFSFHGLPKKQWMQGDPYHCFCQKTARLVAESLGLLKHEYSVCFQSRLGPTEWLKPYTEETLCKLAQNGIQSLDVIAPSFLADCLETIDEIDFEYKACFLEHGGKTFHYIKALNDSDACVSFFKAFISDLIYTPLRQYDKLNQAKHSTHIQQPTPTEYEPA
ncbi:MAG: ferrochelatase [Pseudomonadota bacterium]|nr:ferrochelatase [Pseudomonadota bacterium]